MNLKQQDIEGLPDVHLFRGVLKALILEMAVEEFSAPDGLAHRLLGLGKEHANGAAALLEAEEIDPGNLPPGFHAKGGNRRKLDPMGWLGWRREVLSYALSNGNRFSLQEIPYNPAEHGGLPIASTNVSPLLSHMLKSGDLTRMERGTYKVTEQGLKRAAEMGITPMQIQAPAASVPAHEKPTLDDWQSAANQIVQTTRRRTPEVTSESLREAVLAYAAHHDGVFNSSQFRKAYKFKFAPSTIHHVLKSLQDDDKLERIGNGNYKLVNGHTGTDWNEVVKKSPTREKRTVTNRPTGDGIKPRGYWDEMFKRVSTEIGEAWDWARFKKHTGLDVKEMARAYAAMNAALARKIMKKNANGTFQPTAATQRSMNSGD